MSFFVKELKSKPILEKRSNPINMSWEYVLVVPDLYLVKTKNKVRLLWWLLRLGIYAIKKD